MFIKTIKPWQVKGGAAGKDDTAKFFQGWNACIKETTQRANKFIKKFEQDFNA